MRKFFFSEKIFDGEKLIKNNRKVLIFNNKILEAWVNQEEVLPQEIYHTPHILMPGLVNTHVHLELSHLRNLISTHSGIPGFAVEVMQKRDSGSSDEIIQHATQACKEMEEAGTVLCGDISNRNITRSVKQNSQISFHTFVEITGVQPERTENRFQAGLEIYHEFKHSGLSVSLTAHAPYSVHPELFMKIMKFNQENGLPSCIHYLESSAEVKWMKGSGEEINNIYQNLRIPLPSQDDWVSFYHPKHFFSLIKENTFCVHATWLHSLITDLPENFRVCFCPRSNLYIENRLPDAELVRKCRKHFSLGTDSLASNADLNVWNEMNLMYKNYPFLTQEELLASVTRNGAMLLGKSDKFGMLKPGYTPGLIEISWEENEPATFLKKLV
jgi:cytosine/adenosine deaminase-related metal-dependent hydrolase